MAFLRPKSPAATLRAHEEEGKRGKDTREVIKESITFMWEFREKLGAASKDRLKLYVYDSTPSCGVTWIDNFMVVTHYLAGLANLTAPALLVKPPYVGMGHSLYDTYAENVRIIIAEGTEIDEKNIREILSDGSFAEKRVDSRREGPGSHSEDTSGTGIKGA